MTGYKEHLRQLYIISMEGARLSGAMSLAPYSKKDPMKAIKFEWDEKDSQMSAEEWAAFIKKVDEMEAREGW